MSEQKIVLVNDEKSPLLILKDALAKSGFQVTTVTSGFDALDEIRTEPGDAVVASVSLPDINGFQLSSLIKTGEISNRVPVVLVGNREELQDSFWKRASMSDLVFERNEVEFNEEIAVDKIKKLVETATSAFKKDSLRDHPLLPADLNGRDIVKSYRELMATLLMERSVSHFARSLTQAMTSRVEFMTRFFGYMKRVFGADITYLLVADPQSPWGIAEISGSVNKTSFDKLQTAGSKALGMVSEPRLITHGDLADKGTLKAQEVIVIDGAQDNPLGAVVLGWTSKQELDDESRAVAELLKTQLVPVFRTFFDMQEIQILKQQQSYSSSVDAVTGLYNIEFLIGFLQQQLLFSARQKLPVGLILIDVDGFTDINADMGSSVGDMILSALAKRVATNIRSSDLLARYSGDQFAVVLPNTDITGSQTLAEKLRGDIEQMKWDSVNGKPLHVTVSVGCAVFKHEDSNPETILRDAKLALTQAKEAGRNQVAIS